MECELPIYLDTFSRNTKMEITRKSALKDTSDTIKSTKKLQKVYKKNLKFDRM